MQKKGIWKVCWGMSEFTKGIMGRVLVLSSFSSTEMIGSEG
jgi:hypothetical protein